MEDNIKRDIGVKNVIVRNGFTSLMIGSTGRFCDQDDEGLIEAWNFFTK
jgi:hypothetical protein